VSLGYNGANYADYITRIRDDDDYGNKENGLSNPLCEVRVAMKDTQSPPFPTRSVRDNQPFKHKTSLPLPSRCACMQCQQIPST